MFKFIKEWIKDYNEAQKALNDAGIFNVFTPWGGITTHIINTHDDKLRTIQENNTNSKRRRQV